MPDLLELLTAYGPALRRMARLYAGRGGEQEDLYQEIVLQLWRGLPSFRGASAPGTWLYRVALNTALTWRRQSARWALIPADEAPPRPAANGPRSETAILEEFLAALGPVDRSVLLLYMEGLPYKEIAAVTGLSPGHAAVRLHRIKSAFTERYVEK